MLNAQGQEKCSAFSQEIFNTFWEPKEMYEVKRLIEEGKISSSFLFAKFINNGNSHTAEIEMLCTYLMKQRKVQYMEIIISMNTSSNARFSQGPILL